MAVIGSAEVEVNPSTKGFAQDVERDLTAPLTRSAKKLASTVAAGFTIKKAGEFFKDTIDSATDAEESASKAAVVFGDLSDEVVAFSEDAVESVGLSSTAALEAAGTYGNLFQAFGVGQEKATDMSTTLVQLAGDLASFNNTSVEDALNALRSGLSGETEPLKRFGIAVNEARLKQEALNQGLEVGTGVLDPAVKAQAAYALILQDTTLAQGDFGRTSEGLANQQRILAAEFANTKGEIGAGLLPVAKDFVALARDELVPSLKDAAISAGPELGAGLLTLTRSVSGLLPELGELAGEIAPLLGDAFEAAAPLIGTSADALSALLPVIRPLIELVDAIPDPVLQIAALSVGAKKGLGGLVGETGLLTRGLDRITKVDWSGSLDGGAKSATSSLSKLNLAAIGIGGAVALGISAYEKAGEAAREYAEDVDDLAERLGRVVEGQSDVNDELLEFLESKDIDEDALGVLDTILGADGFGQIRDAIADGRDALDPFRDEIKALGIDLQGLDFGELDNPNSRLGHVPGEVADALGVERRALQDLVNAIEDYDNAAQEGAKTAIDQALRTGELTQANIDAATEQAGLTDASDNYLAVAAEIGGTVAEAAGVTSDLGVASSETADAIDEEAEAAENAAEALNEQLEALEALQEATIAAFSSQLGYERALVDFADVQREGAEIQQKFIDGSITKEERDRALAERQRDLRDSALDLAEAQLDLARDTAEAEGRTLSFEESQAILREELTKVAAELAPGSAAREGVAGLIEDLAQVPGTYEANVEVNVRQERLDEAIAKLKVLQNAGRGDSIEALQNEKFLNPRFGAADGFFGTVTKPTPFITGEGGEPEDVLIVPQSLGGLPAVVAQLAAAVGGGGGGGRSVVFEPGAIQVVAQGTSAAEVAAELDRTTAWALTTREDGIGG